jgi:hypothetical protein
MPRLISSPEQFEAAGNRPKVCEEYIGLLNTDDATVSITHMRSPAGGSHRTQFYSPEKVVTGSMSLKVDLPPTPSPKRQSRR